MSTEYTYLPGGNLESMTSYDTNGQLDKYFYSYDNAGLINGINRNRRGLEAVSGQYKYKYDAIGRLTQTSHDGMVKSAYEYDAFGNRTLLAENETRTSYTYDVLDRLVEAKELNSSQAIVKTYDYDKRGNQTKEFVDGLLQKTFTFDATNMLSKVVDSSKGEVENQYNGLGFRVASTQPEEKIEYLCDLSRDYYNLLERTVNGETESFIYDNNVVSMSKAESNYYYLQDELGSPMYMTGTDGVAVSSYAFDDFGRNIDPRTGKQRKHEYKVEGNVIQPFAFTGYQEDEVSGLKFAQARFYDATTGRFQSEDNVKGVLNAPFSLNKYGYCWNDSINLVDRNGNWPDWVQKAGEWCADNKENLIKIGIGVGVAAVGVAVTVATGGAALPAVMAAGEALIVGGVTGAAVSGGITAVGLAIEGNLNMQHAGEIAQSAWDGFADGVMAGGICYGASQMFNVASKLSNGNTIKAGEDIANKAGRVTSEEAGCPFENGNNVSNKEKLINGLKDAPVEYRTNPRTGVKEPYMKQYQVNDEYKAILRRDVGDFSHGDMDHWNLEVQTTGGNLKYDLHMYLGEDGNILPITEENIYVPKKSPFR